METLEQRVARLEDIERIRALDARYCRALDGGDWDTLVSLFAPEGAFVGLDTARGHEELRTFFGGLGDSGLTAYWHHVTNLEIELDGDRAAARSLLWQPCVLDGVAHVAAGHYADTLQRVDGDWLYVVKEVTFDYFRPLADGWDRGAFSLPAAADTFDRKLR